MLNCSFFSISFFFLFFFLISPKYSSSTIAVSTRLNSTKHYPNYFRSYNINVNAVSVDLINTTCQQCAKKSTIFNYNFCFTSLQAVSISHFTNLQGLAIISMELALTNATTTISKIQKMLSGGGFDPFAVGCLMDCLELYADSVSMVVNSIEAFLTAQYDAANLLTSAAMEMAKTCEEGFKEKEGEVHPLMKENYDLFELSDIALCIISLVSLGLPSLSS